MMYSGSYTHFDFDKDCPQYPVPLHTTYNNLLWMFQQQFAVIYNTMFKSKLTIKLVPITFALFACTRVLTTVYHQMNVTALKKWVT